MDMPLRSERVEIPRSEGGDLPPSGSRGPPGNNEGNGEKPAPRGRRT